jgi:argininosuccinate lyase
MVFVLEKKLKVMGERLKEKSADEVIEYYKPRREDTRFDVLVQMNQAHVAMLVETGIIGRDDGSKIMIALLELQQMGEAGLKFDPYLNDQYMNMESFIIGKVGEDVGGKLHTARSRNDIISCTVRMRARAMINEIIQQMVELRNVLLQRAEEHSSTIMSGYTHTQHAQPITLGHYLVAVADIFERDIQRLEDAYRRINLNPLGACALAGTGFPINRTRTTELLGFDGLLENTLDAISSHDVEQEVASDLAILSTNLSRLGMDLVLWSTYEYGMVEIADRFASISSIMPQKKNPVMAEVLKGGSVSRIFGHLERMQTSLKALPHGISRDAGEVGSALSAAFDEIHGVLKIAIEVVSTLTVNKETMKKRAGEGFTTVTDLADMIVRKKNFSFRTAHRIVGKVVREAIEQHKEANAITAEMIDNAAREVTGKALNLDENTIREALDPAESLRKRETIGGPSPREVMRMVTERKTRIVAEKSRLGQRLTKLEKANDALSAIAKQIAA